MGEGGQDTEDGRDAMEYCGIEDRCDTEDRVTVLRSFPPLIELT